jgi:hypothetical protein
VYQPVFTDDPDRHRLISLLGMLPDREDIEFWNNVGRNGARVDPLGVEEDVKPDLDGYMLGKFEIGIARLFQEPTDGAAVAYFCQYLLKYFDGDRPTLWRHINSRLSTGRFTDQAGERFTRDLCDTAWRIIVRYDGRGSTLEEKWPTPGFMS